MLACVTRESYLHSDSEIYTVFVICGYILCAAVRNPRAMGTDGCWFKGHMAGIWKVVMFWQYQADAHPPMGSVMSPMVT